MSTPLPALSAALAQHLEGRCGIARVWEAACSHLSERLRCTRVSVWLYNGVRDALDELALLDARTQRFSSGMRLALSDFPAYFTALSTSDVIDAPAARTHPATACFGDAYFLPADIHSLLDRVVFDAGEPVAVICCEQCGAPRTWSEQDHETLAAVAHELGNAFTLARMTHGS
ncbi:MAG TPA: GAF domain-containing protein [Burkholderiaceae bacterium]|nr:GAF domain-containing protein [Burkholderiaceae bacterium]